MNYIDRGRKTKNSILNSVTDDLLSALPLILRTCRKKFFRLPATVYEGISPLHHEIMKTLEREGRLHIAEIGDRLLIPRPQMTYLIDKLVDMELVERQTDATDRRTINVTLTDKARAMLEDIDSVVKSNTAETLSSLTNQEMQELLTSVEKLREIFSKLE